MKFFTGPVDAATKQIQYLPFLDSIPARLEIYNFPLGLELGGG